MKPMGIKDWGVGQLLAAWIAGVAACAGVYWYAFGAWESGSLVSFLVTSDGGRLAVLTSTLLLAVMLKVTWMWFEARR
jgi:hypothetical protein